MDMLVKSIVAIGVALSLSASVVAQSGDGQLQHFAKDGLVFNYPSNWKLLDKSDDQFQQIIITNENSSAVIMVSAMRDLIGLPAQIAAAREQSTDVYITDFVEKLGAESVKRSELKTRLSHGEVDGVRLQGLINSKPAAAEIYSFLEKLRFVNVLYVREDQDSQLGSQAWETLRESLFIETPTIGEPPEGRGQKFPDLNLQSKLVKFVKPAYPIQAKQARISGDVVVRVLIDEAGNVLEARAVSGPPELHKASIEAARKTKFSSTVIYGQPVRTTGKISYTFR